MRTLSTIALLAVWTASAAAADSPLAKRAADYLAPVVKSHDLNGVVLIARGETILVQKAYGQAD